MRRLLCWLGLHKWRKNLRVPRAVWSARCCVGCGLVEYTGYGYHGGHETRPYGWHELGASIVWP